jgi:hypothetical protein
MKLLEGVVKWRLIGYDLMGEIRTVKKRLHKERVAKRVTYLAAPSMTLTEDYFR